jgi:DNA-binding XRE family transcriptional regulator
MTTLEQKLRTLSPERRKKIAARARQLVAEEMSLRELRHAHKLTQQAVAKKLGISQDGISRLEQRSDLMLSTIDGYVRALGGRVSIIAEFPDRKPIMLSGIGEIAPPKKTPRTPR